MSLFIALLLAAVTTAVYWPITDADFIHFDDFVYIVQNPDVLNGLTKESLYWAFTKSHWHPVTWLSHMLDVEMSGMDPMGHHVSNLLIHLINTLLVFFVLWRFTGHRLTSGLIALLFAVHPLHVEPVAWITQRKTLLFGLFWMLCLAVYGSFVKKPNRPLYLLMVLLFILGLMSKWMIVTLPFVMLLLDYWPLKRIRNAGEAWFRAKEKIPFFLLSFFGCVIALTGQKSIGAVQTLNDFALGHRLANALVSYVSYIEKTFWPHHLAVFYPYPESIPVWKTAGALIFLAFVTSAAVAAARKYPYLFVGWFWFLGTLVPVIGSVQVGMQSMADRYAYIPVIGLFIIIVRGIKSLLAKWRYGQVATGVVLAFFCFGLMSATHYQVGYWANSIRLFKHTLSVTSGNYLAHNNLGVALVERWRIEEAATHFKQALELEPGISEASDNLKWARSALNRLDIAADYRRRFLPTAPDSVLISYRAGNIYRQQGHLGRARASYQKALTLQPGFVPALDGLGLAHAMGGDYKRALSAFKKITRIWPEGPHAYYQMACIYAREGMVDTAVQRLKTAVDKGFDDRNRLKTDPNLANLRNAPEFIRILENM